jgi:hypothetical protein
MGNVVHAASELVIDTGPEPVRERQEQDPVSSRFLSFVCCLVSFAVDCFDRSL